MASAMAPGMPQHNVGIRPGEKLHEIMITSDDARATLDMGDRFVITPVFHFWTQKAESFGGASLVAEDFAYTSDRNTEWLGGQALLNLLAENSGKQI